MKLLLMPLVVSIKLLKKIVPHESEATCDCVVADVSAEYAPEDGRAEAIERTTQRMWQAWADGEDDRARYLGDVLDHLEEMSDSEFLTH